MYVSALVYSMVCLLGSKRDKAHLSTLSRLRLRATLLKANSRGFTRSKHQVLQADIRVGILAVLFRRRQHVLVSSLLTIFASAPVESVFPILSTVVKRVKAMSDTHTDSKPMV